MEYYHSPTIDDIISDDQFIETLSESLGDNVNLYFDNEGGQPVIYVESIELR